MKKAVALLLFTLLVLTGCAGMTEGGSGGFVISKPGATATEAPSLVDDGPSEVTPQEDERPWTYPISREILDDPDGVLILVNKQNVLDKAYPSADSLVNTKVRKTSSSARQVRDIVEEALVAMFDAAEADGVKLYLHSAYRSYRNQAVMYENRLKSVGKDDGVVQLQGASDHQTGMGFDVISKAWIGNKFNEKFAETKEAQWMAENAPRFGFIIRYPKGKTDVTGIMYEPWHLRYVGAEVAEYMTEQGLTLEEFTEQYRAVLAEYQAMSGWNMETKTIGF